MRNSVVITFTHDLSSSEVRHVATTAAAQIVEAVIYGDDGDREVETSDVETVVLDDLRPAAEEALILSKVVGEVGSASFIANALRPLRPFSYAEALVEAFPGAEVYEQSTGGGCEALFVHPSRDLYLMLTVEGSYVPSPKSEFVDVGVYWTDGDSVGALGDESYLTTSSPEEAVIAAKALVARVRSDRPNGPRASEVSS
jgi:hypothetical protein